MTKVRALVVSAAIAMASAMAPAQGFYGLARSRADDPAA